MQTFDVSNMSCNRAERGIVIECCSSNSDEKTGKEALYGQWKKTDGSMKYATSHTFKEIEFFDDGTYISDHANMKCSYSVTEDRLKLEGYLVEDMTTSFEVKDGELHFLKDGDVRVTFKKK